MALTYSNECKDADIFYKKKSNTEILYSYKVVTENKLKNSLTFSGFPDENGKFSNIKYINFSTSKVKNCRKANLYYYKNNAKKVSILKFWTQIQANKK